jgi:5-methylthioadenosine/S-adenosylhomocysteine deaminase
VPRLRAAGVPVALGTDGPASNNDLDLFGEMQTAALLAKGLNGDPSCLGAAEVIEMATLGGAAVLGLDDEIGSLEAGKAADLIAVEFTDPGALPLYNPLSQLVYTGCGRRVSHVWVAGQCVLEGGVFRTIDLPALRAHAREWCARIAGNLR